MPDPLKPNTETALQAWADRVRANHEQVGRFREVADGADFYAPVAQAFRAQPDRTEDHVLNTVLDLAIPGETWLDIGAGGGRYGLPLARKAGQVIAVDPSEGMLQVFREDAEAFGIGNVRIIHGRWPIADPPKADAALIANVGMDIEDFGPFLDAMEASARRLCVAVMGHRQATVVFDQLWPLVHDEARVPLPSLPEFLVLLLARGRLFELRLAERPAMTYSSMDELLSFVRRQTWVTPGSEKDKKLQALLAETATERDGRLALSWEPVVAGVVSWKPGPA